MEKHIIKNELQDLYLKYDKLEQENRQLKEIVEKVKEVHRSPLATNARYYYSKFDKILGEKEK